MLLSRRTDTFSIPHTSTCIIKTVGVIEDGQLVDVVSPVFASINFNSKAISMSDTFKTRIKILNDERQITSDGECYATLVCDDDDVFGMYVRVL